MLNAYEPLLSPPRYSTHPASGLAPSRCAAAKQAPPLIRGGPVVGRLACGGWRRQQLLGRLGRAARLASCPQCPAECARAAPPCFCCRRGAASRLQVNGHSLHGARAATEGGRRPLLVQGPGWVVGRVGDRGAHQLLLALLLPPAPQCAPLTHRTPARRPCCLLPRGARTTSVAWTGGHGGPLSAELLGGVGGGHTTFLLPCPAAGLSQKARGSSRTRRDCFGCVFGPAEEEGSGMVGQGCW